MDIDVYLAEHMIRDRLAEARARAEFAARLGSLPANGIGRRRKFVRNHEPDCFGALSRTRSDTASSCGVR